MEKIPEPMFNLPEELIRTILEFCIDKRDNWGRVNDQFLKGLFMRNIAICIPKLSRARERWLQRFLKQHRSSNNCIGIGHWEALRPTMLTCSKFGRLTKLPIITEWCLKTAQATGGIYINGELQKTIVSAANPVTEWLENIKEFEKKFPSQSNYSAIDR
tara:strand:- start:2153 stop:2629 length:477 start_codon:yes stop_codon:yes gene_type:complete